ncbi:MAG: GntR family transcriptional regulator [Eubacteriales bacterium]|nr:GntR family transcriptional regulator [Eubacteriales bacterium]
MNGVKHGMLRADVYKEIKENILKQIYQPGESLTESRLCTRLGVSRTPVREAFAQLESDGLVESVPNKGVIVRGLAIRDIKDIYDIRCHVESSAVKLACSNLNDEGKARMQDILRREKQNVLDGDLEGFQNSDYEFHDEIIKSSGSRIFHNVLILMMQHSRIARIRSLSAGNRMSDSLKEHFAVYDALVSGDPGKCCEVMTLHINNAKESYINTIIEKGIAYE